MLGAIRRVISGEDVSEQAAAASPEQQQRQQQQQQGFALQSPSTIVHSPSPMDEEGAAAAALVEEDDPQQQQETHRSHSPPRDVHMDAPMHVIDQVVNRIRNSSDTFTTSSSLSDTSTNGKHDVTMEDVLVAHYEQPLGGGGADVALHNAYYHQQLQQHAAAMQPPPRLRLMKRVESDAVSSDDSSASGSVRATTSQNSSRDWGWFEDVHLSGNSLTPSSHAKKDGPAKTKKAKSRKSSARRMVVGLDPKDETAAAAMAVTAPTYVLEESLSSQRLWKDTAGCRPPQPVEERAFYEKMWAQNFARSQVNYQMPVEVLTATSPISLSPFAEGGTMEISAAAAAGDGGNYQQYNINVNAPTNTHDMMMTSSAIGSSGSHYHPDDYRMDVVSGGSRLKEAPRAWASTLLPPTNHQQIVNKTAKTESGDDLTVLVRGDNVFGTTVSKSFACSDEKGGPMTGVDTVNISIASYRVVESTKNGKYAQFLVIYREGSIRDTIGVWKRYSDFDDLAKKVTQAHEGCASVIANMSPLAITEEHEIEHLPNAITSWRLLKKRQRWYRCLDAGYLSLKVFLLERFLHDILFESSSPKLLREFVGGEALE